MWKLIVSALAISLVSIVLAKKDDRNRQHISQLKQETMFADVIKNISRVNHVLQELITNYKRLQDIYKSEEYIDADYSYDEEIDEVYKEKVNKNKRERRKKRRPRVDKSETTKSDRFPATQMIWSDEHEVKSEVDEVTNGNENIIPPIEGLRIKSNGDESTSESKSNEATPTTRNGPEFIFIDTHKKNEHDLIETKPTSAFVNKQITPKTRFKQIDPKLPAVVLNITPTDNIMTPIKKIEPKFYMRQRNISSKRVKNPEMELQMATDTSEETKSDENRRNNDSKYIDGNNSPRKKALVIVAKNNKNAQVVKTSKEDALNKDLFKTNVLRTAYGEACLKLVLRKCYNGCKGALDLACTLYRCKGSFKDTFKQHSKTGCIKEFKRNNDSPALKTQADLFGDTTRAGYLEGACLPEMTTSEKEKFRKTIEPGNAKDNLNILRDKYERECQKLSATKCNKACLYAMNNTCYNTPCIKGLEKRLKRTCKSQCLSAYRGTPKTKHHGIDCSTSSDSSDSDYDTDDSDDSYDSDES